MKSRVAIFLSAIMCLWVLTEVSDAKDLRLLNASYDPTRELYQDFNAAFAKYWKGKTGQDVIPDNTQLRG